MRLATVTCIFRYLKFNGAAAAILLAGMLALTAPDAQAQANDAKQSLHAEFNAAYAMLLKNPSDVDLTLKYADLAVRLNDYEAAIPPLERLVMINPTLYRTRLKLGTFYLKLGSKLVARSYFDDLVNTPEAPQEVVEEAKRYLQQM